MQIVLWDTRQLDAAKDFAGGFGVGQYPGRGGWKGQVIRHFYKRDRRPTALNFAYMASILKRLGHSVQYSEDTVPPGADVYIFNPSLVTLHLELAAIRKVNDHTPTAKVLVIGLVAHTLPEAFKGLTVTLVRGEAEQLNWKFDEALACTTGSLDVGRVQDLDELPFPDWSLFEPKSFRISYDFWKFPTSMVQLSRGCTFKCNYCPYIIVENSTRFRAPERVVDEMKEGIRQFGFKSFKFRDPLFGLDRKRVLKLAELIGGLPRKIQFSIESRIDLMRPETLKMLKEVGLTAITVGIETPSEETLRQYKRAPINDDRQREFVALCRELGVRTVAGFMIGFPEDNEKAIRDVYRYAKAVNPTWANFNIVTPYPGTEFFHLVKDQIANFDFSQYSVYNPVMKYQHLTPERVAELHSECFQKYYFRGGWLRDNAALVWPWLRSLGLGRAKAPQAAPAKAPAEPIHAHVGPPKPMGLPILEKRESSCSTKPHEHS